LKLVLLYAHFFYTLMIQYNKYTCCLQEFYIKLSASYYSVCSITSAVFYKIQVVSFMYLYLMHILACTG